MTKYLNDEFSKVCKDGKKCNVIANYKVDSAPMLYAIRHACGPWAMAIRHRPWPWAMGHGYT